MSRASDKFKLMVRLAEGYRDLSTCKRLKVGCIIFPDDFSQVVGVGYNSPPRGQPNDSCRNIPGACGCAHAESNALIKAGLNAKGCTLLTTLSPCLTCAGLILNSGVARVVWTEAYRNLSGLDMLTSARLPNFTVAEYTTQIGDNE